MFPMGISDGGPKREKLETWGADVYDDITSALLQVPGILTV
jgi:hypothetical protein